MSKKHSDELTALADRLDAEDLFPDDQRDFYWPELSPEEMAVIIASLRAKARAA